MTEGPRNDEAARRWVIKYEREAGSWDEFNRWLNAATTPPDIDGSFKDIPRFVIDISNTNLADVLRFTDEHPAILRVSMEYGFVLLFSDLETAAMARLAL